MPSGLRCPKIAHGSSSGRPPPPHAGACRVWTRVLAALAIAHATVVKTNATGACRGLTAVYGGRRGFGGSAGFREPARPLWQRLFASLGSHLKGFSARAQATTRDMRFGGRRLARAARAAAPDSERERKCRYGPRPHTSTLLALRDAAPALSDRPDREGVCAGCDLGGQLSAAAKLARSRGVKRRAARRPVARVVSGGRRSAAWGSPARPW
jgi:hypothetical protein